MPGNNNKRLNRHISRVVPCRMIGKGAHYDAGIIGSIIFILMIASVPCVQVGHAQEDDSTSYSFGNKTTLAQMGGTPEITIEGNSVYVIWPNDGKLFLRRSLDNGKSFEPQIEVATVEVALEYRLAISGNTIQVAWIDAGYEDYRDRGIFIAKSQDAGASFASPTNISTNRLDSSAVYLSNLGLTVSNNIVHVSWIMSNYDWMQIYYARSTDNGNTFSNPMDLSRIPSSTPAVTTNYVRMSSSGNNVYLVWQEYDESRVGNNVQGTVRFSKSNDGGNSFDNPRPFSENGTTPVPKIVSQGTEVYVTWFDGFGVSFKKSQDSGESFGDTVILTQDFAYPEISLPDNSSDKNLYLTYMTGRPIWDVYLIKSKDASQSFSKPMRLTNTTIQTSPYSFFVPTIHSEGDQIFILFPISTEADSDHISLLGSKDAGDNFSPIRDLTESLGVSTNYKAVASESGLHLIWTDNVGSILYAQYSSSSSQGDNSNGTEDPSTDNQNGQIIQTWSEPEGGALYSEILIYANFCPVFENHDNTDVHLNITSTLKRPDGQTEQLSEFAEVNENDCERIRAYSFIPQLAGDYTVRLMAHTDDNDVSSNPVTVRIVSEGIFQSGRVTVILDSEQLRALDHAPAPNYVYAFRVLDWSPDGKSILFGYRDHADTNIFQTDSLGIIDTQSFNVTRLDILNVNENNTKEIYLAKFSPSSESVFVLLGSKLPYPGKPENIFEYHLENRTLSQITNSSSVYWFDTLANVDGKILIYIDSTKSHFWPTEDEELSEMVDRAAARFYYYLPSNYGTTVTSGTGILDLNEEASRLVFTGEIGGLVGSAEGLDAGIHLVQVQSGEATILTTRTSCVSSAIFAPNDDLILYTEHPGQLCPEPTADMGSSLRIASLDGTRDEIVYNDRQAFPIGVISPDGRFVATLGSAYMVGDQYPKMLIVELPRPVPEFGIILAPILMASILCVIIAYNRFGK